MEKIKQSFLETAKKIEALGEKSQAITEVVTLIEDIANQTNLLSLNAAIEAARAGEAGKGFAVVADAIGKLADRTTKSTKDIADLIKGIQQDTSSAVMSMEESTKETEKGTSLAQEAGKSLKEIVGAFEHVAQSAKEIALANQQQTSGSEQISKAMVGIDQIMKLSAAGAKQSTESARQLASLAEELKKAVAQFKLGENEKAPSPAPGIAPFEHEEEKDA
jgi:methyl-accepting chemotaxis protein